MRIRETEEKEKQTQASNTSFKMKSIVGTRYQGEKEQSKNQAKVYDFLFFEGKQNICLKTPFLKL